MSGIYEKSKLTKYIEALNQLQHCEFDQYRATAFIMDAVFDSNDLEQLTYKTLKGAKGNLQRAFNVSSLRGYIESKQLQRIEPFLAAQGDILVALDEDGTGHDDIAFCAGKRWVYFDDEDNMQHERFSIKDHDVEVVAYRLA